MSVKIHEVIMPQLGVNDETASIVAWMPTRGEQVRRGQILAQVETSKASFELEAEEDGFFYPVLAEGVSAPIQAVIAVILSEPDEAAARSCQKKSRRKPEPKAAGISDLTLTAGARKLMEEHRIDPTRLPRGRIIRERDVRALMAEGGESVQHIPVGNAARRIVIYGASEGGDCVADLLRAVGGYEIVAFLEDNPELVGGVRNGVPIRSGQSLAALAKEGIGAVTTHIANPEFRLGLMEQANSAGMLMLNAIHPAAFIAPTARIGVGNLIKAGAIVDTDVVIGDCCIIDNGVIIPHHNRIGNGCHLAPGVSLGGGCCVGNKTIIGIGATVSARISIGENVIVGVGAVVARDVPDNSIVEGAAARIVGARK